MIPGVSLHGRNQPPPVMRPSFSGGFLLVAAPLAWRDACFSVPAVRAIRRARPRATLGVLCPEGQQPLWESAGIGRVLPCPARASARWIAAMIREQPESWDSVVLWEAGVIADACARAGIAERIGPPAKGLAKRLTRVIGTDDAPGPVRHRVRDFLGVVEALGIDAYVPENFEPAQTGVRRDPGLVLLAPDSDFGPSHEWQIEKWVEVGRFLREDRGCRLTVAGMAGCRGLGRALAAALGEEHAGFIELQAPGDSLPLLAEHATCVGADSSLAHLAAHVGVTCISLFGPGDPEWMRPLGRRNTVVRRHVECAPCLLGKCPLDLRCQRELGASTVIEALRRKPRV